MDKKLSSVQVKKQLVKGLEPKHYELLKVISGVYPVIKKEHFDLQLFKNLLVNIKRYDDIVTTKENIRKLFNDLIYPKNYFENKFKVPPVSYFDTKTKYWSNRKQFLIKKYGNMGETIDDVLGAGLLAKINKGASFFDPVLCEIIISWFNTIEGRILNPFCGEASIGLIAGDMGCQFVGVDVRQEQVDINNKFVSDKVKVKPKFICGNSVKLDTLLDKTGNDEKFDLIFSSPPYYDLEIYSNDKDDLSTKQSYEDFMDMYKVIFSKAIKKLHNNRFLVVKVGEIRDKAGVYRNFVGGNIKVFKELGLHYYNEIILLNQFGTAPMRFNAYFKTRKMVKIHQNLLIFFKGDVSKINSIYTNMNTLAVTKNDNTLWK